MFIVGFENTMHFLAAPLPCQMFHLGFVFHFLTTDRLSSCGVKCPSCVGGWLQRPYCLKTRTVPTMLLSPPTDQYVSRCIWHRAASSVCVCGVCMCAHMGMQIYLPVWECVGPGVDIGMPSSATSPYLFIHLVS